MSGWKFAPECRLCVHAKCRADKHPCNVCMSCVRNGFYRDNFDAKGPDNAKMGGEIANKSVPNEPCEACADTGWYGDNGPGIKGNRECHPCDQCMPFQRATRNAAPIERREQATFDAADGCVVCPHCRYVGRPSVEQDAHGYWIECKECGKAFSGILHFDSSGPYAEIQKLHNEPLAGQADKDCSAEGVVV